MTIENIHNILCIHCRSHYDHAEKATIIVKQTGKCSSPRDIVIKLGRHIDTIRRYFKNNSSPRKQRYDSGV